MGEETETKLKQSFNCEFSIKTNWLYLKAYVSGGLGDVSSVGRHEAGCDIGCCADQGAPQGGGARRDVSGGGDVSLRVTG